MTTGKKQVEVTIDNFWDLFPGDFAAALADGLEANGDGEYHLSNDSPLVTRLVQWVENHNRIAEIQSEYRIDRVSAAMVICASASLV